MSVILIVVHLHIAYSYLGANIAKLNGCAEIVYKVNNISYVALSRKIPSLFQIRAS
jgi:hypothetical protein